MDTNGDSPFSPCETTSITSTYRHDVVKHVHDISSREPVCSVVFPLDLSPSSSPSRAMFYISCSQIGTFCAGSKGPIEDKTNSMGNASNGALFRFCQFRLIAQSEWSEIFIDSLFFFITGNNIDIIRKKYEGGSLWWKSRFVLHLCYITEILTLNNTLIF